VETLAVSVSLLNVECPSGWWLGHMQMAAAILAKRPKGDTVVASQSTDAALSHAIRGTKVQPLSTLPQGDYTPPDAALHKLQPKTGYIPNVQKILRDVRSGG